MSKEGYTYLSADKGQALMWARNRASAVGGKPVVLKVDIPNEGPHVAKFEGDTFRGKPIGGGNLRYRGSIPKEWVRK